MFLKNILVCAMLLFAMQAFSQTMQGKVIDKNSKEALAGCCIYCNNKIIATTNDKGEFELSQQFQNKTITVTYTGFQSAEIKCEKLAIISLEPSNNTLNEISVSANREGVKRSLAPVAIANINSKTIKDTKATTVDQLLNKVSGVYMVNLGNEQHMMSIRQPMTTKSMFLYLEDGIPIRTTGLFNHNALLEMNMAAVKNIEVIKGPSSSLYGSEAIGGAVNFITASPTAVPVLKLSLQGNDIGYKRADLQTGFTAGKWGVSASGYYADKRNSFIEYSDFHKGTFTAKVDYRFNSKTYLTNGITWLNYYSDMPGGIDSAMYVAKSFSNPQTFTYRQVNALRYHSTLVHEWNDRSKTTASIVYRDNTIIQNPSYSIKDDYRYTSSGWKGDKTLAHGEINNSSFSSYAFIAQHRQNLNWKKAVIIAGANIDISPSTYTANYIRINKDTISKKYTSYQNTDSMLALFSTNINNYAAFVNFEFSPIEKLRVVASLRYDLFSYKFDNSLPTSSYSGATDTIKNFSAVSPKIGFTYNFSDGVGIYANYSQGFVPPQITDLFKGVKVPNLDPSVFYNYEVGGWVSIIKNKLTADISAYSLQGTNEIISVRLDDGSYENRNAGRTSHKGIELGLNANPIKSISVRFSGAYSKHTFVDYVEKGISYNKNEMAAAPNWLYNTEVWYRPAFVNGLRLGAEWQHVGSYWLDPQNTAKIGSYNVFNVRVAYQYKNAEIWVNALNVANTYYAYTASKSAYGYSYNPGEPRNFNIGVAYDFGSLFNKKM
ncbi:TonB-dependent receptor [Pinibacter aurantiacus]|uniref:TonB-dependent receptor n=1 Tax=Pinibacter aurantiacus TaxID=2851599 RepID=A0A9E2S7G7_9BACT|nr:TonB-dependent receptor [Pinibacter aurantiacus]MBV4356383.1 TonB-dependent receptor [Pinibacter aurantiacus]